MIHVFGRIMSYFSRIRRELLGILRPKKSRQMPLPGSPLEYDYGWYGSPLKERCSISQTPWNRVRQEQG